MARCPWVKRNYTDEEYEEDQASDEDVPASHEEVPVSPEW